MKWNEVSNELNVPCVEDTSLYMEKRFSYGTDSTNLLDLF